MTGLDILGGGLDEFLQWLVTNVICTPFRNNVSGEIAAKLHDEDEDRGQSMYVERERRKETC